MTMVEQVARSTGFQRQNEIYRERGNGGRVQGTVRGGNSERQVLNGGRDLTTAGPEAAWWTSETSEGSPPLAITKEH